MNQEINMHIGQRALKDISDERGRQEAKWGQQNHDDYKWITIITEELGEAAKEAIEAGFCALKDDWRNANNRTLACRKELVEVAACAIAAIEAIDRRWSDPVDPTQQVKPKS